jgi:hypothetical protein
VGVQLATAAPSSTVIAARTSALDGESFPPRWVMIEPPSCETRPAARALVERDASDVVIHAGVDRDTNFMSELLA